jgi:putative nucleotidyltransferase with HDIG domain
MHQQSFFTRFDQTGNVDHDYQSLSDSITTLPTLRSHIVELVQSVEETFRTNISFFAESIRKDQSLVAQVLKVARSSAFAQIVKVDTINDAIQLLGVNNVRDIALASSFLSSFLDRDPYKNGFDWKSFWKHSNTVGVIASSLSRHLGKSDHERYYTAGLLHDMGKMGAFCLDEERMLLVARVARKHRLSFLEAELITQAPRHDRLGEAICRNWNLPEYLKAVCRHHHTYSRELRPFPLNDPLNDYIDIVILSNHLANKLKIGYSGHSSVEEPIERILASLSLSQERVEEMTPLILAEIEPSSVFDELLSA